MSIQFPETQAERSAAMDRLKYDEAFLTQCALAMRRHAAVDERPGFTHETEGADLGKARAAPSRSLSPATRTRRSSTSSPTWRAPHPMNRLLLGDVGTGKTVVAAHALCAAADSGTQAAMMAPTEVLAAQYALKVGPLLDQAGIPWVPAHRIDTCSRRAESSLRPSPQGRSSSSSARTLFSRRTSHFDRLTLAIVDEQHRFGVDQRLALRGKGAAPDLLVMTATPIPRSLALTLYGDLATSYLREKPNAESIPPVGTRLVARAAQGAAYDLVRDPKSARGGRPTSSVRWSRRAQRPRPRPQSTRRDRLATEVFPDLEVGLLTGRMRPAEKADVMDRFRAGDLDVLVSTTVIEVGVDVPNATVMIVEDAERFGLAQLHQLRGRVGRGEHPGHFLLFADPKTEEGRTRMQAIVSTTDGFELAEEDLRLAGRGRRAWAADRAGCPHCASLSLIDDLELISTGARRCPRPDRGRPASWSPRSADLSRSRSRRALRARRGEGGSG